MNPPLDSNTDDLDDEMEELMEEYCDDCGRHVDECRCGFEDDDE